MLNLGKITTGIVAGALLAILSSGCAAKQAPLNDTWTASAQAASASASRSEAAARRAEAAAARVEAAVKRAEDAAARIEGNTIRDMNK
jgi:hypothetical protein